jgi:hypothetical protein
MHHPPVDEMFSDCKGAQTCSWSTTPSLEQNAEITFLALVLGIPGPVSIHSNLTFTFHQYSRVDPDTVYLIAVTTFVITCWVDSVAVYPVSARGVTLIDKTN